MQDAWHIVKWIWAAVFFAYMVVQVLAIRRLKGNQKRRSNTVLTVMLILMGLSDAIRDIFFFEDRTAGRVGMVIVAVAAVIATIILVAMFGESPTTTAEGQGEAEPKIQSLKLN